VTGPVTGSYRTQPLLLVRGDAIPSDPPFRPAPAAGAPAGCPVTDLSILLFVAMKETL